MFTRLTFILLLSVSITGYAQHDHPNSDIPPGKANQQMYSNRVSSLIRAFDNPGRDEWQKPEVVIDLLDPEGKVVMDLGAGSGYFSFKLADVAQKVIAADVNDEFIQHLEQKKQEYQAENVEVRKVPYDNPGLKKAEADAILLVNAYHHIQDRAQYFNNALSGLKPGGQVMVVDYRKDASMGPPRDHKLAGEVALEEMEAVGFSKVNYDTTSLPHQYIITGYK